MMSLLMAGGPYYIIGFVITFFTLMNSHYLLGEDIHPQDKFMRIVFVSIFWVPALIVATGVTYIKRGSKLDDAKDALAAKQKEIDELRSKAQEASIDETDAVKKQ